jgi:hypothetical protein
LAHATHDGIPKRLGLGLGGNVLPVGTEEGSVLLERLNIKTTGGAVFQVILDDS